MKEEGILLYAAHSIEKILLFHLIILHIEANTNLAEHKENQKKKSKLNKYN